MDIAKHEESNEILRAVELDQRIREIPAVRADYQGKLICPKCNVLAIFRKRSKNGNAAHFYAKHRPTCYFTGRSVDSATGSLESNGPAEDNHGTELWLRINPAGGTTPGGEIRADGSADTGSHRRGSTRDSSKTVETAKRTVGLRSLLAHLIEDPSHVESFNNGGIRISHQLIAPVLNWGDLDSGYQELVGKDVVLWGRIFSANLKDWGGYLNQGAMGQNKAAIDISPELAQIILEENRKYANAELDYLSQFAEWYVIALGRAFARNGSQLALRGERRQMALLPPPTPS